LKKRKVTDSPHQDHDALDMMIKKDDSNSTHILAALAPAQRVKEDPAGARGGGMGGGGGKVVKEASEALELLLCKGHQLLEEVLRPQHCLGLGFSLVRACTEI
jgi:hypothetical protein